LEKEIKGGREGKVGEGFSLAFVFLSSPYFGFVSWKRDGFL